MTPRVFEMRRLFRSLMGKAVGIMRHENQAKREFYVRIDFNNSADMAAFYRELERVGVLVEPKP